MCGASKAVKKAVDATQNTEYAIGQVKVDGHERASVLGALHAVGAKAADCIYCVNDGQLLTISHSPQDLQKKFGLDGSAVATFRESAVFYRNDVLDFGNGKRVQLRAFADRGVLAYTGVKERQVDTGRAVADLLANATDASARELVSVGG